MEVYDTIIIGKYYNNIIKNKTPWIRLFPGGFNMVN